MKRRYQPKTRTIPPRSGVGWANSNEADLGAAIILLALVLMTLFGLVIT